METSFPNNLMACRLLYLVGQLRSGGSERQLYYLLLSMDRERYKPAVVVWNYDEKDVYVSKIRLLNVPLYFFPEKISRFGKIKGLRKLVSQLRPEIFQSYSFFANFVAYVASWGKGSIPVGSVRSDFIRGKTECGHFFGNLNGRWPRYQISNSFSAAESLKKCRSFFVSKRLFVVSNGLNLDQFRSVQIPIGGKVKILGVGTLSSVKRWDRVLVAAKELKQRGFEFSIRIAGDGPLRNELRQKAENLDVTECVEFLGQTNNIPDLLGDSMFLVHTASFEGCPNVVMEAMACARAVVATDAGDIPSLVEDGETGFVIRGGDDNALVERMAKLISNSELCQQFGKAARVKAEREFGLDRLVSKTLSSYRSIGFKD